MSSRLIDGAAHARVFCMRDPSSKSCCSMQR
jgi:hypothetical protein